MARLTWGPGQNYPQYHFSHILFSMKVFAHHSIVRIWGGRKDLANLHVAQPYPLARPPRTLHKKMLISDRAILKMEKAGWCEAGGVWRVGLGGNTKSFFLVSTGVFFQGNYKKFRIHSGTCSSLNEFPSVSPPPKKYRLVQYSGFYCI